MYYQQSVYNQLQRRGHISPYILILTEDFELPVIETIKVEVDNVIFIQRVNHNNLIESYSCCRRFELLFFMMKTNLVLFLKSFIYFVWLCVALTISIFIFF